MDFIETSTSDGKRLVGFASSPHDRPTRVALLHVHGYGGDGFSNRFVRVMHRVLPDAGIAFVSFQMRTSGYIIEQYSDTSVEYVGSALVDPIEAAEDVATMYEAVSALGAPVVCQGHSFGTNLVKYCLSEGLVGGSAVFLSPADSRGLQKAYAQSQSEVLADSDEEGISWSVFGISTNEASYPIPIDRAMFKTMQVGPVFGAWSEPIRPLQSRCLVIRGAADGISKMGLTETEESLRELLPNMELTELATASHTLSGCEVQLTSRVAEWLQTVPDIVQ